MLMVLSMRRRRMTSTHSRRVDHVSHKVFMEDGVEESLEVRKAIMVQRRRRARTVMQDRIMTWRWVLLWGMKPALTDDTTVVDDLSELSIDR
jgi:hypothetical protein